jgi:hypothetical protein
MTPNLTFIIPVRHPENSPDWTLQIKNLKETVASIANQDSPLWRCIIVANRTAEIPAMPSGVDVERVDFPPNPHHEKAGVSLEVFYDAVRLDKGRRLLAGLIRAKNSRFVMIVDDDDFVSRRLTSFVAANQASNGWVLRDGLVWGDGGKWTYRHDAFSDLCGTSRIVRTEIYKAPATVAEASEEYIKRTLGSHRYIDSQLAAAGTPLAALPFPGAVYRIGHASAHSKSRTILNSLVFNRQALRWPHRVPGKLARLRLLSPAVRQEFFGPSSPA